MVNNPFILYGYESKEYFCDRKEETSQLLQYIENGNNVALIAPRRIGKTGLIENLFHQPKVRKGYYTFLIDIYATVNVDIDQLNPYSDVEKEDIKARIISAIKIFIDGGYTNDNSYYPGLLLGEDFIPHKLAVFLDDEIPELKNINFNYPEDYIQILDEEIGTSNTITIEMI